jgi:hypothetical protein
VRLKLRVLTLQGATPCSSATWCMRQEWTQQQEPARCRPTVWQSTCRRRAAYEQERLECTKAHAVDDKREHSKHAQAANAHLMSTPHTVGTRMRARPTKSNILHDEHGMPNFP